MNFYVAIKLAKITLEQMFLNCVINFLETKKNEKNKNSNFDYCLYYSLLTAKNFSKKLKNISDLANNKLNDFNFFINNNKEINTENFYNNLHIFILYYEIDYGIMASLDVTSKTKNIPWNPFIILKADERNLSAPGVSQKINFISSPFSNLIFFSNLSIPIVARQSHDSLPEKVLHIYVFPTFESPNNPIFIKVILLSTIFQSYISF